MKLRMWVRGAPVSVHSNMPCLGQPTAHLSGFVNLRLAV